MRGTIDLHVNGRRHRLETDPERTLLAVLRADLDLTGTKYGCGEGRCGACTVIVEGRMARSCRMSVAEAAGKEIRTIEGLEQEGRLHPLQEAFLRQGAMQCGFCVPGMIMAGAALLAANQDPDESAVVHHLQGNVCRCGTYRRIVAAVRDAASAMKGEGR